MERLAIIGVGMIGGSVAQAAKTRGLCREVVGIDRDPKALEKAFRLGVIDRSETSITEGVKGADGVVIATPVGAMKPIFEALKPVWNEETFYTDVGSTKRSVIQDAALVFGQVPRNFIPGHPIAGRERSGVDAADESLFRGKRVILTPLAETDEATLDRVRSFWQLLGAEVHDMSPVHHDHVLAATSHLPHLLAYALTCLLGRKDEKDEIFQYAAGGFKDFSRIASSDAVMWRDICLANRDALLPLIDQFLAEFGHLRELLASGEALVLQNYFQTAKAARERFLEQYERRERDGKN